MPLYLIGLGLGDHRDITVKGLEIVKSSTEIYLESYTSVLGVDVTVLEEFYGKKITVMYRDDVEVGIDDNLEMMAKPENKDKIFSLLVIGDPFCATTHVDLYLRAKKLGIEVGVVHNASIMNAVGCCGLHLYDFGKTISLCFFKKGWRPTSWYSKIAANRAMNSHTLCLLDIRVKEQDPEDVAKENNVFQPPEYMSCQQCAGQLLEIEKEKGEKAYDSDTMCVGLARVGQKDQKVVYATLGDFLKVDMGPPLHSFIICSQNPHFMETDVLELFRWKGEEEKGSGEGEKKAEGEVEGGEEGQKEED